MDKNNSLKIICRNCNGKFDVSDFEPFSSFPCPNCGTKLRVPRQFAAYLLEKICGKGGMSVVYRAIDTEFSRYVALKVMNEKAAQDENIRRYFMQQAQLMAKIDHPGVVSVYATGECLGLPYLVMRYMDSGSLEQLRCTGQLPDLPVLLNALAIVAGGLQALLRGGIIHHDVKPGNILYHHDGSAGLADFDLAEGPQLSENQDYSSQEWASPAYVSPEWLETGHEDFRGDIFSFGVSAYELLTNQIPYPTDGDAQILWERRRFPLHLPAHELNPAISGEFSKFLDTMMAFRPSDRPDYPEIIRAFQKESQRLNAKPGGLQKLLNIFSK